MPSLWDNWVDERDCDEGHLHVHTKGLRWGFPEVVESVEQVYCSRRILLQRRLEFHVCAINKSAHTKKSRNLWSTYISFDLFRLDFWWRTDRLSYLPNPSAQAGYDTRSIFKRSLTGFNSEFSFSQTSCLTKAEEPSLSYYLPIVGGRIIGFIPFPRVLVLCEMLSV